MDSAYAVCCIGLQNNSLDFCPGDFTSVIHGMLRTENDVTMGFLQQAGIGLMY